DSRPRRAFLALRFAGGRGHRNPGSDLDLSLKSEAWDGLGEALELERADGIELEDPVERGHGLAVGEDLAGLRLGAEARGEVGDVADGSVVPAALEADGAERGVALRNADAEA